MLIIGGGLLSAYRLGQAGVRCALIEAERICGGWDALTAFVRESYPGASGVCRRATQGLHDARRRTVHQAVCREHAGAVRGDGFSRWGMTTSVAVANLLSDLLQGRENRAAALFSPARSMLRLRLLKKRLGGRYRPADAHADEIPAHGLRAEVESAGAHAGLRLPWIALFAGGGAAEQPGDAGPVGCSGTGDGAVRTELQKT